MMIADSESLVGIPSSIFSILLGIEIGTYTTNLTLKVILVIYKELEKNGKNG